MVCFDHKLLLWGLVGLQVLLGLALHLLEHAVLELTLSTACCHCSDTLLSDAVVAVLFPSTVLVDVVKALLDFTRERAHLIVHVH